MSSLQMVSNLFLLVPLLVTGDMNVFRIYSYSASKVRERHSVLVLNIGTFAEEDEAYELLNNLSVSLPLVVIVTCILDALLAGVYLKWLHPWKILLQEVSSLWLEFQLLNSLPVRNQNNGRLSCMTKKQ